LFSKGVGNRAMAAREDLMARIQLDESEVEVAEEVEEVLTAIVSAKDGLRHPSGAILAPPGWIRLTESGLGETIYMQVARINFVRAD
jgi:hypothetical protein